MRFDSQDSSYQVPTVRSPSDSRASSHRLSAGAGQLNGLRTSAIAIADRDGTRPAPFERRREGNAHGA